LGLIQKQEPIEKANDDNIEKALEFEKTGKEIAEALQNRINSVTAKIEEKKTQQAELVKEIGSEPDTEDTYWGGNEDKNPKYKRYAYPNKSNGIEKIVEANSIDDIENKKSKYNDLCWNINNLISRLNDYERLVRNLNASSKKKFKLSEYELSNYGF
jgi:hypothetical protein